MMSSNLIAQTRSLFQRQGIHCMSRQDAETGEELFLFCTTRAQPADQTNSKVATVVRLSMQPNAAASKVFVAFTTKDPMFNDNFDFEQGKTVPVENCTFGAAKVFVEAHEISTFCYDETKADVQTLVAKFEAMKDVPEEARARLLSVLNDATTTEAQRLDARREFMAKDVLAPRIAATDKAVLALAQKKGIVNDALVQLCQARAAQSSVLFDITTKSYDEIVSLYIDVRMRLLDEVADTNPRIAKLALGRQVLFPLVQDLWISPDVDLGAWSVFFVRRFFMAQNPDHAFLFCLLHLHGLVCEVSDCDDLWAKKVPEPADKQAGALCFVLSSLPTTTTTSLLLDSIEDAAPSRKLGVVNRRVALSLLGLQQEENAEQQAAFAQAYLTRCGWASWFNTRIAPRCAGNDVIIFPSDHHQLPDDLRTAILATTLDDVAATLRALSCA